MIQEQGEMGKAERIKGIEIGQVHYPEAAWGTWVHEMILFTCAYKTFHTKFKNSIFLMLL